MSAPIIVAKTAVSVWPQLEREFFLVKLDGYELEEASFSACLHFSIAGDEGGSTLACDRVWSPVRRKAIQVTIRLKLDFAPGRLGEYHYRENLRLRSFSQQTSIGLFVKSDDQSFAGLQRWGAEIAGAADGQGQDFLSIAAGIEAQQFLTLGDQDLLATLQSLF